MAKSQPSKQVSKPNLTDKQAKDQIINQIRQKNKDQNIKIFAINVNPFNIILILIAIIAGIYGFYTFFSNSSQEVNVGEFVQNLKSDKYSKIVIQDTGKAYAQIKNIDVVYLDSELSKKASKLQERKDTDIVWVGDENLRAIDLGDLIDKLDISPKDMIQGLLRIKDIDLVDSIFIGEDYIIAKVAKKDGGDYLVKELDVQDFKDELTKKGIQLSKMNVEEVDLKINSRENKYEIFEKEYENGKYEDVWIMEDLIIAVTKNKNIQSEFVNWASITNNFSEFLQAEGVQFKDLNTRIESQQIPQFSFWDLLTILMLVALVFVGISLIRGISGSGKGLMQFGQSKAKMFFGKKPDVTFDDVAGIDEAKEELNEVVLFLKDPKRFLKLGARIPKGLLMVGSPGTGKTLLARAIAGEAKVPFFHTSGSEFEEMLVGAGASRVRDLFAKAKKASPALVFIDEIDAVARKRGTTVQSSTTEQTLNQILVEMDGFEKNVNVIVIAATNRPDVLDPAILRPGRFDRRIVIDLPDIKGREEILRIHSKNKPLAKDVDLRTVARRTVGYSGADLENMLNEAAIIVAKIGGTEISFNDIEEAANRVVMGRERKIERTQEELKKTAYHEAGHAIVAKLTPESDPVHRITIVSRGMALGVTMQLPERDKYSQSYTEMESRLSVYMAGRAAEELIYGASRITSGAANDIEQATKIARRMVKQYGYSKKLGLVKYGESNELQYLGYGYGEMRDFSDDTARLIDEEVKKVIDDAYKNAFEILKKNKEILEKIASDLLEKEVLEAEEFGKYFKK